MARPGWVYIVSHPRIRRAVKVGGTARRPTARVAELGGAGVPEGYRLHAAVRTADWRGLERRVHARLRPNRLTGSEWFSVSPRRAKREIDRVRLRDAPARLLTARQWVGWTLAAPVVGPALIVIQAAKWTALTSLMLAVISGMAAVLP